MKNIKLVEGSKYQITSIFERETPMISTGIFRGYVMVGEIDALCIELDSTHGDMAEKLRLIPSSMILAIDIISMAEEKTKKDETIAQYVG